MPSRQSDPGFPLLFLLTFSPALQWQLLHHGGEWQLWAQAGWASVGAGTCWLCVVGEGSPVFKPQLSDPPNWGYRPR